MEVTPEKRERLLELALFLHRLAASIHALVRVEALGNFPQTVPDIAQLDTIKTSPRDNPLPHLAALPGLRAGGIKIFVSDFLFPFDPAELIAMFPRADRLVFVQVVSEFEDNPSAGGEERPAGRRDGPAPGRGARPDDSRGIPEAPEPPARGTAQPSARGRRRLRRLCATPILSTTPCAALLDAAGRSPYSEETGEAT